MDKEVYIQYVKLDENLKNPIRNRHNLIRLIINCALSVLGRVSMYFFSRVLKL